ncbi:DUF4276 family protein [Nostocales cyanobacterium LEGE 11386]|nr:DUF4276 family protein [Nostocales cyanobacterium LEGE 11386]
MKIAILVEGATETAFKEILLDFLRLRLQQRMPTLRFLPDNGRIPKEGKLRRKVENLLTGNDAFNAVIAITDVYTGTNDFQNAADAKAKMRDWVGNNSNFYPHAAQYDFEAWLLPYWTTIQRLAGHNKSAPRGLPEQVNHNKPPSYHIKEIFEIGKKRSYSKTRDAAKILKNQNLMVAINLCPELKAFINTILSLCEVELIP